MSIFAKQNGTTTATQETPRSTPTYQNYVSPHVNIFESPDGYVVEAELPGVAKEDLDISVEASTLTILGKRTPPEVGAESLYRESSKADYRRVFELDPAIDTTKIEAKLDQGILTVQLPKSERVKPRKVTVVSE